MYTHQTETKESLLSNNNKTSKVKNNLTLAKHIPHSLCKKHGWAMQKLLTPFKYNETKAQDQVTSPILLLLQSSRAGISTEFF